MPQIEVTFDIDANGILNVTAKDMATGKQQKIEIKSSSGLTETDIEKMRKDAESHAADQQEEARTHRGAQRRRPLSYSTRHMLEENKDKVNPSLLSQIMSEVENLDKVKTSDDVNAMEHRDGCGHQGRPQNRRRDVQARDRPAGDRKALRSLGLRAARSKAHRARPAGKRQARARATTLSMLTTK